MAYSIDLSGRVAMVTGASSGLGAQFARVLARSGAAVVLAARRLASTTAAPARERVRANCVPSPPDAPVMKATRPERSML